MVNQINKTLSVLCLCVAVLCFSGCDQVYKFLDKNGAEEKELIGAVDLYEKNPKIEEVQGLLKLYGYSIGRADGILGGQTRKAIIQFQQDNHLEVTRYVDKATWIRLNYFRQIGLVSPNLELNIKMIQQILNVAGFPCGNPDGKLGSGTMRSIKNFQAQYKLKPDGRIGFKTLNAFSKYLRVKPPQSESKPIPKQPRKKFLGIW